MGVYNLSEAHDSKPGIIFYVLNAMMDCDLPSNKKNMYLNDMDKFSTLDDVRKISQIYIDLCNDIINELYQEE